MIEQEKNIPTTIDKAYSDYLDKPEKIWWKRLLDVQMPYRWHIKSLQPGFVLDVGCGIGRNLLHLKGHGVGIDHNEISVEIAVTKGLQCFTNLDFKKSKFYNKDLFDSILISHVAEHMEEKDVVSLLSEYMPLLKSGGRVIFITPQEKGFSSDPTHVQFMDFAVLNRIIQQLKLEKEKQYSFPFPLFLGKIFTYNEFILIARKL